MTDYQLILKLLKNQPDKFWMHKKVRPTCLNSNKNKPGLGKQR